MRILNFLDGGLIPYLEADRIQRETFEEVRTGKAESTLIIAQFEATYTAGRNTKTEHIVDTSLPVVEVDRGGSITWHGPGQLVIYPVIRLADPTNTIGYIRAVEAAVLEAINETWNLAAVRIEGRAGAWILNPDRKICAIGLKIARGATLHGLALNIDPDLSQAFTGIIPCGLYDAGVTSLEKEGCTGVTLEQAAAVLAASLTEKLTPLMASKPQLETE